MNDGITSDECLDCGEDIALVNGEWTNNAGIFCPQGSCYSDPHRPSWALYKKHLREESFPPNLGDMTREQFEEYRHRHGSDIDYWIVHTAGDSVAALVRAANETDAIRRGAEVYLAEFHDERGYRPDDFTTANWWAEQATI